ncbi:MAG: GtrA family protein [Anaerolineaceae bacterium]|nr:GtrA family protein [Anaerolineaceae bacterium]
MILTNPQERSRFLRFAVVGVIGAVVDFGAFNILTGIFKLAAVLSSVLSFTAAVTSNFLWNRFWTYPDSRSKNVSRQVIQFAVVSLIGLGIRTPLFAWLEKVLIAFFDKNLPKTFFLSPTFAGHNIALAIAVLVVMMWNFLANRYWTYNDVS